jgi:hypothetical protein
VQLQAWGHAGDAQHGAVGASRVDHQATLAAAAEAGAGAGTGAAAGAAATAVQGVRMHMRLQPTCVLRDKAWA